MEELLSAAKNLAAAVARAIERLDLPRAEEQLRQLREEAARPDFWSDAAAARQDAKRQARLEQKIAPWRALEKEAREVVELAALGDDSLQNELADKLASLSEDYAQLKAELRFSGLHDEKDAIVSIHAGAGGTDAQDWARLLMRMYARWAEKSGLELKTIDESPGEEAGIKSATLAISGPNAYGRLKGEHGVHRLVRLSPFNADNLRQTSFAKVEVVPKIDEPSAVAIDDNDLRIDVYRSGGRGGQSVNTTDSAVRVTHLPTGIVVAIQNERSQLQNKGTAMTILRSRLARLQLEQHAEKVSELKGPNEQAAWGNQIRSYVLHPYKQVKDLRTRYESSDPDAVLDGDLDTFLDAYLEHAAGDQASA